MARLPSRRSDKTRIRGYETANGQSQVVSVSEQFFFGRGCECWEIIADVPFQSLFLSSLRLFMFRTLSFQKDEDVDNCLDDIRWQQSLWSGENSAVSCLSGKVWSQGGAWLGDGKRKNFFYGSQKLFQCFFFNKSVIKKTKHSKYKIKIAAFVIS